MGPEGCARGEVTGAGWDSEGAQSAGEAGLGDLEPGPGGGGGSTQARRGGAGEAGPGEREPLANRYLPAAHVPEREEQQQRAAPGEGGGESGRCGTGILWVPAPVTWAPDPAAAGRPAGWSVRWSVGQCPASRFSALRFGGGWVTGVARTPELPGEEPRTQVSGLSPLPQAPCAVRSGSPRRSIA